MRIIRSAPARDCVRLPVAFAQDERLSHMARGCMAEIWARPDGGRVTAEVMWRESVEAHGKRSPGLYAYEQAFAQLRACGYLAGTFGRGAAK